MGASNRWTILVVLFLTSGCKSPLCEPGTGSACACEDGVEGVKLCDETGRAWLECTCPEKPEEPVGPVGRMGGTGEGTIGPGKLATIERGSGGLRGGQVTHIHIKGPTDEDPVEVDGSTSPLTARRVLRQHVNGFRYCCEKAEERGADFTGSVALELTVGADGSVEESEMLESSLGEKKLEKCITRWPLEWSFPAPEDGDADTIRFEMTFVDGKAHPEQEP